MFSGDKNKKVYLLGIDGIFLTILKVNWRDKMMQTPLSREVAGEVVERGCKI
jgi:hypothetical protein